MVWDVGTLVLGVNNAVLMIAEGFDRWIVVVVNKKRVLEGFF